MAELLIMFREVLEASLIIGILYTYLKKSGNDSSLKMLWSGVLSAVFISVLASFLFQIFADGFDGKEGKIFEGIVMIVASIVLTTMIIWMAQNKNISEDLKNKAKESLSSGFQYGIFTLAFVAVFREGVEIILFLYAIGIKDGISVIPSIIGSLLGLFAGYAIFIQGVKIPLKKFFNVTSVFLIFVAAGMLTYGVHELESGGVIPYFGGNTKIEEDKIIATRMNGDSKIFEIQNKKKAKKWASRIWDINPSKNNDGSYPVLHDKGAIGGLLKGFFGYNGDPSLIEFITWLLSMVGLNYLYQKIGRREKII
ncbi:MAG: hypothetical protein CMG67_03210 [Candidatus Marinimicrobia bacterium]|nr:hypothetical protein [Candidatus Neomarinimicrobiota bacterium]|tara:strand:+ start:5397 stop:6326 length:930 start_codon:yes stop_codon:yes gene_type:complete